MKIKRIKKKMGKKAVKKTVPKSGTLKRLSPAYSLGEKFAVVASALLLIVIFLFTADTTANLLRLCFYGDAAPRLKCSFTIDGAQTSWAYADWTGLEKNTAHFLGFSDEIVVNNAFTLPRLDQNTAGTPLNINNVIFSHGIGSHAPSKVAFDLQGRYQHFSCQVGLDKLSGGNNNHGVIFSVIADHKEIYRTPKLDWDALYPINCDVTGAQQLILFADNTELDNTTSYVDWVDLKFDPLSSVTLPKTK